MDHNWDLIDSDIVFFLGFVTVKIASQLFI